MNIRTFLITLLIFQTIYCQDEDGSSDGSSDGSASSGKTIPSSYSYSVDYNTNTFKGNFGNKVGVPEGNENFGDILKKPKNPPPKRPQAHLKTAKELLPPIFQTNATQMIAFTKNDVVNVTIENEENQKGLQQVLQPGVGLENGKKLVSKGPGTIIPKKKDGKRKPPSVGYYDVPVHPPSFEFPPAQHAFGLTRGPQLQPLYIGPNPVHQIQPVVYQQPPIPSHQAPIPLPLSIPQYSPAVHPAPHPVPQPSTYIMVIPKLNAPPQYVHPNLPAYQQTIPLSPNPQVSIKPQQVNYQQPQIPLPVSNPRYYNPPITREHAPTQSTYNTHSPTHSSSPPKAFFLEQTYGSNPQGNLQYHIPPNFNLNTKSYFNAVPLIPQTQFPYPPPLQHNLVHQKAAIPAKSHAPIPSESHTNQYALVTSDLHNGNYGEKIPLHTNN